MTKSTRNTAFIFCIILVYFHIHLAASYYRPRVYNICADSSEITYEYYELPSDIKLTQSEFEAMKALLSKAVSKYNHRVSPKYREMMQIASGNYGIQYEVRLDEKGNKIIRINAFAKDKGEQSYYKDLTTKLVVVFDGGSNFFGTVINLKRKKATPIRIHGFA